MPSRLALLLLPALALAPVAAAATDGPWYTDPAKGFALLSLVIFFAIVWRFGGFRLITGALDKRGEEIGARMAEAKTLRDQATKLLAEAERKQKQASEEAEKIIAQARMDAKAMLEQADRDLTDRIARREAQAEARIARAEAEAAAEVRRAAADAATRAARDILSGSQGPSQFNKALGEVEKALS